MEFAQRGKESSFVVYCPTTPNVQIERIDERGERIEPKIRSLGNNEWKVSYTIVSVGKYEIRASCPNRGPLPGSPWTISSLDANKVIPVGGWGSTLDNEGRLVLPVRFVFDTSHAGPGELLCSIDGRELGELPPFRKRIEFPLNEHLILLQWWTNRQMENRDCTYQQTDYLLASITST